MKVDDQTTLEKLSKQIEGLSENMHKMNVAEYIELMRSPKYMLYINFISGLARGLGIAVGATILGAVVLMLLFRLAELNIPFIGFFIAKVVKIVQTYL